MYVFTVFWLLIGGCSRHYYATFAEEFRWKHLAVALQYPHNREETCSDTRNDCHGLKKYCSSHEERLKTSCRQTCGYCVCRDRVADCPTYKKYCEAYGAQLKGYCDLTCGFCTGGTNPTLRPNTTKPKKVCRDRIPDCSRLAKYCKNSGDSLRGFCDYTCGFCKRPSENQQDLIDEECVDKRADCGTRLVSYCNVSVYAADMRHFCRKTCGFCVPCVDEYPHGLCTRGKKFHKCDTDERMLHNCRKTCGFCALPAPPLCSRSQYGCCWDRQTTKLSVDGENCPPCLDKYLTLCNRFRLDCRGRDNDNGRFMRKHCPETCNLCEAKCIDDPIIGFQCQYWKEKNGWCTRNKQDMRFFCPRTCDFCKKNVVT